MTDSPSLRPAAGRASCCIRACGGFARLTALALSVFSADLLASNVPPADPYSSNHPLLGKWTWTRPINDCTEVYEYRASGVSYIVSGAERTDNTYTVSAAPTPKGFYRLAAKVIKDYGGKDCFDSVVNDTGTTFTVFIMFDAAREMHIVCKEENLETCFGPLRRVPE